MPHALSSIPTPEARMNPKFRFYEMHKNLNSVLQAATAVKMLTVKFCTDP